jgi:formylglycine-generating enzyme required for sulfatase activity
MVSIPAGKSRGRIPKCDHAPAVSATEEPVDDSGYDVAAFEIDRRPVSCVDYEACMASGGCKAYSSRSACSLDRASVTSTEAATYCKWRGARLPEYNEWQRAVRGAEGRVYVTGKELDRAKACLDVHRESGPMNRVDYCEQTTPEGIVFATQNVNLGEWTRTAGCRLDRGQKLTGPVAAYTIADRLDLVWVGGSAYEFRCARNLSR